MSCKPWLLAAAIGALALPALAATRQPFEDAFYVRRGGDAASMYADRDACRREAMALGSSALAYSNPQYGALSAMGEALDSDALHEGGLKKRMQRAVLDSCMRRSGWEPRALGDGDRGVARASPKKPQALDAWLKANEPPPLPPPEPAPAAATAPASSQEKPSPNPATPGPG